MTKLKQIEKSVSELNASELQAFVTWFQEFQAERWDIRFEQDAKDGALDALAEKALSDFKAGRSRSL